jgi:hypothetical protein
VISISGIALEIIARRCWPRRLLSPDPKKSAS